VHAVELLRSPGDPAWVFDPENPLASEEGYVVLPVIDVAGQMADLIVAQRSYQMNLEVIRTGEEAYQAALRIGKPQ
jgi:flagellar basal-body rod protein FlgC